MDDALFDREEFPMSIKPVSTSIQGQAILAQYQSAPRTAALQHLNSAGLGDTASFGSQAQALSDIAIGAQPGTATDNEAVNFIARLPSNPQKLERLAQRIEAQVAKLKKKHGSTSQTTHLGGIADAIRQRAKTLSFR